MNTEEEMMLYHFLRPDKQCKTSRLNFMVSEDFHTLIKSHCINTHKRISEFCREACLHKYMYDMNIDVESLNQPQEEEAE